MSFDTYILLRTSFSVHKVKRVVLDDPLLADLHLTEERGYGELHGPLVCLVAREWEDEDRYAVENGFDVATARCKTISGRGDTGMEAQYRVIASILRGVPGDTCIASQDNGGPGVLRLGDVVYVDPDSYLPEDLTRFGYTPPRLVIGIPKQSWWT